MPLTIAPEHAVASRLASDSEPAIELDRISVRFNVPTERIRSFKEYMIRRLTGRIESRKIWAVDSVSLTVAPGEIVGLVGRNGAGKSTLLKVVCRVLQPTQGRVIVRGSVAPLLELGAGFHPDLTGRENTYLNAAIFGLSRAKVREHMDEVIEFSELRRFIDAPIRTYSAGMVARLGFSVATMFRPDILIVDEVLAVGDALFRQKCFVRIAEFCSKGTSILLVSHDAAAIRENCSRAIWIDRGKILEVGDPDRVLESYDRIEALP